MGDNAGVAELLAAIADARSKAALAYEFSGGNGYAYAAMHACDLVGRLAGVPRTTHASSQKKGK